MINQDTNYKLIEIIHDTWPNLFRPPKKYEPPSNCRDSSPDPSSIDASGCETD